MCVSKFNKTPAHQHVGERFGSLTIIAAFQDPTRTSRGQRRSLLCRCDCGSVVIVREYSHLTSRNNTSCGCRSGRPTRKVTPDSPEFARIAYALTGLHHTWRAMLRRCRAPRDKEFLNYGGRGVQVCEEWQDYLTFAKWALFQANWRENLTIDRVNTYICQYQPGDCRFATRKMQARNRRTNRLLLLPIFGILCPAEIEERLPWLGTRHALYARIKRHGEDAVEEELGRAILDRFGLEIIGR